MGLVRPCGCGPGEFGLCRTPVICRFAYSQVIGLGFHDEVLEDLTFRRYWRGVGQGCRVGGEDWAWRSRKKLKLMDLVVVMQR